MNTKRIIGVILLAATFIFCSLLGKMFEDVDAGEVVVIQHLDGTLEVFDQPTSWAWQGFGKSTHYRRSNQYEFLIKDSKGGNTSIPIGFNDGGYGRLSGSIRYDLPVEKASMIRIHTHFGSQESVESHLIKTNMEKAAFASGPLMSSRESYAEKKNDLIFYLEDQASHGAYKTKQVEMDEIDPLSNVKKVVTKVQILKDSLGRVERQEVSPIYTEGIRLYNLSLQLIDYDDRVKEQIKAQQTAIMAVQTSMAESKQAEQKALTIEAEGKAAAAKAKWEQEVIKAEKITKAQADSLEAAMATKTAALRKQQLILEGEGEAEKKKLIMQANGALEQKLEAYVKVQGYWADAFKNYQGNLMPQFISGNGPVPINAANQFMEMMMIRSAKDLGLNLNQK